MVTTVVAEAGLRECARYGVCGPELGIWMVMWAAAWVLIPAWLAVSFYATAGVLFAKIGLAHTVLWLLAVWILPILGVIAWFRYMAITTRAPSANRRDTGNHRHPWR